MKEFDTKFKTLSGQKQIIKWFTFDGDTFFMDKANRQTGMMLGHICLSANGVMTLIHDKRFTMIPDKIFHKMYELK